MINLPNIGLHWTQLEHPFTFRNPLAPRQ